MAGDGEDSGEGVNGLFDTLKDKAGEGDEVSIGELVETLGHRGYGPLFFIPAILELSPIGAIPGVPSLLALIIAILAVQVLIGRKHPWMPGFLANRSISGDRLSRSLDKMRGVANFLDRWFHKRLERFAGPGTYRIAAVVILGLCLTVPPLELVPFASSVPMGAIALIGLAMLLHDGALMLAGFALAALAVAVGIGWLGR